MHIEVQNSDETPQDVLTSDKCASLIELLKAQFEHPELQAKLVGAVCVRTVGLEESQHLNAAFRGQDKPTNVLSFPAEHDGEDPLLGDLAICWPVVEAEASAQGKSVGAHATHLCIHGLLHLLGFDHESDEEADEMEAFEVGILATLGIANPYR